MNKEDRISDLPDHIIHHILSFLSSTKQAIQTGILSKRWKDQWTRVPVLIFNFFDKYPEFSEEDIPHTIISDFSNLINNTLVLHHCSKLKKFHLHYPSSDQNDPQLAAKIRFATSRDVEDLSVRNSFTQDSYVLPEFLFSNVSLLKLKISSCTARRIEMVNWRCLTTLDLENCYFYCQVVEHILSGSPLLESLKLKESRFELNKLVVASKSLKRFILRSVGDDFSVLEVSCPKLEVLSFDRVRLRDKISYPLLIEKVLSVSLLLESFEFISCEWFGGLVIASKSLKNLFLGHLTTSFGIEISCRKLAKMKLKGYLVVRYVRLQNLPSSLCATVNVYHLKYQLYDESRTVYKWLIEGILEQLQNVKTLKIGSSVIKILSTIERGDLLSYTLNIKCLTLDSSHLKEQYFLIQHILQSTPYLEKLVIKLPYYCDQDSNDLPTLNDFGENDWNSNTVTFNCLESHLKTIKVIGFHKRDDKRKLEMNFVRYLLRNAKVLEKVVVVLDDHETAFAFKVSQELLSLRRCSQDSTVELLFSK